MEVAITAPGASRTRPTNHPVLPLRGAPKTSTTSSTLAHTRNAPTRHNSKATSVVRARARATRGSSRNEGRTVVALRRTAMPLARRRI